MNIKWTALTRVDTIDSSLLKLMKKAGCTILSLGIESGSNVFHRDVKKTSIETIKCAFEMIKQADIKTRTTWIIGLGKTYDDEYQSLQLIKELPRQPAGVIRRDSPAWPSRRMACPFSEQ